MKALIVSLGSIGRRHLGNLRQLRPDARIAVLRTTAGEENGVDETFTDIEAALAFRPDVAVIASPAPFHLETAIALAHAGTHLLIEKPLDTSLERVDELRAIAAARRLTIAVGYNLRFFPPLVAAVDAIRDRRIGRVLTVHAAVGQYLPEWRPGRDYRKTVSAQSALGGGALLELSHELDYVQWLAGAITVVMAMTRRVSDLEIDVEDTADIIGQYENGALGSVHLDLVSRVPFRTCRVSGSEGVIEIDFLARRSTISGNELPASGGERNDMYLDELRDFLDCVATGRHPRAGLDDGVRALQVALAAKASSASGAAVRV